MPKHNGGFRIIHHVSYPKGSLVNNEIVSQALTISYTLLQQIFDKVLGAEKHAVLLKQDVKDVFQNISVAPHMQ